MWRHNGELSPARWAVVREREDVRVFHDLRTGMEGENKQLHVLLTVGTIVGALDDAMYGVLNHTTDTMRLKTAYVEDTIDNCAVLATVLSPTVEKPFQSMTIKWMVKKLPLAVRAMSKNRDAVYVESMGMRKLKNGERIGFQLLHSIDFPQTPPLPMFIRANISICSIWRQLEPDRVQIYTKTFFDVPDKLLLPLVIRSTADALVSVWRFMHCAQMKKITWFTRRRTPLLEDGKRRTSVSSQKGCSACGATSSRSSQCRDVLCGVCSRVVCKSCRVKRELFYIDLAGRLMRERIKICVPCLSVASRTKATHIAIEELNGTPAAGNTPLAELVKMSHGSSARFSKTANGAKRRSMTLSGNEFNPSTVLDRLERQQRTERVNLIVSNDMYGDAARHLDEEFDDTEAPILARFINHVPEGAARGQPDETLRALTNFTTQEFDSLWGLIEADIVAAWTTGRGRQSSASPRDAVFMTLTVLKHYNTWQKHAIDFEIGISSLEKVVHKVIGIIEPILYSRLVKPVNMEKQIAAGLTFQHYPQALYATDVKFQPAYRPSGRFTEQKVYFSAKHKLYGFKLECSVALPGLAVDLSEHRPGSASDLTMLLDRVQVHRQMLRKASDAAVDVTTDVTTFPNSWAMLVDKGYQGAFRRKHAALLLGALLSHAVAATSTADSLRPLSSVTTSDVVVIVIMAAGLAMASAGGVGGGTIVVPLLVLGLGFDIKYASPSSNFILMGGAIANAIFNLRKRHPHADRPLVDPDVCLAMVPAMMGGAVLGAFFSRLLPSYAISILFVVLLALAAMV
ncbi:hypothetical protein P43SY_008604 [Pythium insidiosum]|uniref:FYVE-type domain-containing protein n=1 Tax=Pythium insidiosum TaxID=114742 RepID=A0AAD5LS91_PYTIN|nr:hypothetical protein P43SY_008604 [Pythium insidiosum]